MTGTERIVYHAIPLLALPDYTLFPGALVPRHLTERHHLQLVEDLLDTQGRLVLTALRPGEPATARGPAFRPLGTLAEIASHRRQADGHYFLFLLGLERVHATEVTSGRLYRQVDAVVLEDEPGDPVRAAELRPALQAAVQARLFRGRELPGGLDLGLLADLLHQHLALSAAERETAFLERSAVRRAELALAWLERQDRAAAGP